MFDLLANRRRDVLATTQIVAAALAFLPGIAGNFQLDDVENLAPIQRLVDGDVTWHYAVFSNRSGILGRPVAMATFALNAWATGLSVVPFRLVNLALHAICGLLLWQLAARVMHKDSALAPLRRWLAPAVAVVWVLLPIHVSTVLYIVQRMAVLASLFTVLALLAYFVGRERALAGGRRSWIWLFLVFPALTVLAALSKENGLLAPAYALALELGCYGLWRTTTVQRPPMVVGFFVVFVGFPALAAALILLLHPEWVTAGYVNRDFTLVERLLTEPRVLWDYVRGILVPVGSMLGLVQDDYPLSRTLISPPSTLAAMVAWAALIGLALKQCGRRPAIAAGILFFLAGHAMESSLLPLEIRFDHRNYLPAFGVLLATVGAGAWLLQALAPQPTRAFARAGTLLLASIGITYALATMARSAVWADDDAMFRQMAELRPDSPRLQAMLAARAMEASNLPQALLHVDLAEKLRPEDALAPAAWRVLAYCMSDKPVPGALVDRIGEVDPGRISLPAMKAIEFVATRAEAGECPGLDRNRLAETYASVLGRSTAAPTDHGAWRTRYHRARLLAAESRWPEAIAAAEQAWRDSAYNNGIGVLVFQLHASAGDKASARRVLERLRTTADPGDLALAKALEQFQQFVDS